MSLLDFIFPKTCLGCGNVGKYLCQACMESANKPKSICPYCKHPSIDGATHTNCGRKLGIDGITSIWKYEGVIRKAILALKYKYATEVGREISEYAISSLDSLILPNVDSLAPIPIHWHKQNIRGFNQSIELGGKLAVNMRLNFMPDLLIKKVPTRPQAGLSGEVRRQNLRDTIVYNSRYPQNVINSVLLFDDVFTTGSTMLEATKVLKKAGVETVWGLTIAR